MIKSSGPLGSTAKFMGSQAVTSFIQEFIILRSGAGGGSGGFICTLLNKAASVT
jgi:hypothetical protein